MHSLINDMAEDRKKFHRSIDQYEDGGERCEHCDGPLEQSIAADPGTDSVEYYSECLNPDCPGKEGDN